MLSVSQPPLGTSSQRAADGARWLDSESQYAAPRVRSPRGVQRRTWAAAYCALYAELASFDGE